MLLTITTTHTPATDLGYLLHKHPDKVQTFNQTFGQAHLFYPEADDARCTAALLLEVDPIHMVRVNKRVGNATTLGHYVNDRPYVAASFMSVAIADLFSSALNGRCQARSELVESPLPLRAYLPAVPCRGGEPLVRRLFEPLGYTVVTASHPLDPDWPEWGDSSCLSLELQATLPLRDLLRHLYVLLPVLDNSKHYYIGPDEADKLLAKGEGWLAEHPEREVITRRYLRHCRSLVSSTMERLLDETEANAEEDDPGVPEDISEKPVRLNTLRIESVLHALRELGARSVGDLGCGSGKLLRELLKERQLTRICGMDVSHQALEGAASRLRLDHLSPQQRARIELIHGSLLYRDKRLKGYDALVLVEVIEHLDLPRLDACTEQLFGWLHPPAILITTPNHDYNVCFEGLEPGSLRHSDHRFEWSREQFADWTSEVAERHGYAVEILPIGAVDPRHGAPTQMGVFTL